MTLTERWTRYCMKIECRRCGNPLYDHEEDARMDVEHIISNTDFGVPDPGIQCLRAELSWFEHRGKFCSYCQHMLNKDD